MSLSEDHGYFVASCSCGWKGWSDTGGCERCDSEAESVESCEDCGSEFDKFNPGSSEAKGLCCNCASKPGVSHTTGSRTTFHTARRDHSRDFIKAGDRYRKTVEMGYIVGGGRWLRSNVTKLN